MGPSARAVSFFLVVASSLAPGRALAWGAAMHEYINWAARGQAQEAGRAWDGLDLQAYLAASPGPDIWYAADIAEVAIPRGIEEDWEYVRLMFAHSRNIHQLSFTTGYAGHIVGDVAGHVIYLAPHGNDADDITSWIAEAQASPEDIERFFQGPPPEGQWELEHPDDGEQTEPEVPEGGDGEGGDGEGGDGGGCSTTGRCGGLLLLLALALAALRRNRLIEDRL